MKRLLLRLAGGYAGLGALVYLVHRARYAATSQVRAWTDHRAGRLAAELDEMRDELTALRRELRRGSANKREAARAA